MTWMIVGMVFPWLVVSLFAALGGWVSFQLVHQNGRLLTGCGEGPGDNSSGSSRPGLPV